eukprot:COSAG02_NODE_2609_length_8435_cov_4.723129_2_plen_564_part_00
MGRQQQRRAVAVTLLLGVGWYVGSIWPSAPPTPQPSAGSSLSLPAGLVKVDDEEPPTPSLTSDSPHESIEASRLQARVEQLEAQLLQLRTSTARAQLPQTPAAVRQRPVERTSSSGTLSSASSRWRDLEQLHAEWDLYLINLPRRQDKLACSLQDFARVGLEPRIITGIDGSELASNDLRFINKQRKSRAGHRGCLYAHLEFLLHRLGRADCVDRRYHASSLPKNQRVEAVGNEWSRNDMRRSLQVKVNFTNAAEVPVLLLWLDYDGNEIQAKDIPPLAPGASIVHATTIGHVWRVRAASRNDQRLLAEFLVDAYPPQRTLVIEDCASDRVRKHAMVFEDDVTFDDDFAARFLKAAAALPPDWDLFLLNWYCTTESLWKEFCEEDSVGQAEVVKGSGLVPVKIFMSGAAFAVSAKGAEKIIRSLPCREERAVVHYGEYEYPKRFDGGKPSMMPSCSAAIDWHLSNMVEHGTLKAFAMMPEAVWMPNMGTLHPVTKYRRPSIARVEKCFSYKSDIVVKAENLTKTQSLNSLRHARGQTLHPIGQATTDMDRAVLIVSCICWPAN